MKYIVTAYSICNAIVISRRETEMRNEIAEKVEVFLQNLRCENRSRETLVHLDSCQEEQDQLEQLGESYKLVIEKLQSADRKILEQYREQMLSASFAEQQEAYLQGIVDAFQILCGVGMLSTNENVEKMIVHLKNGSLK